VNEANGMAILDFLKARGIKSTFFISGPFVFADSKKGLAGGLNKASFNMIRKMVDDGHEFGNHTQTHPRKSATINWERENAELKAGWDAATKAIFKDAVPSNARMLPFWRAPYGEYDERSLGQASRAGYPLHFGWNVDVLDAAGLPACKVDASHPRCVSPATMTKRIVDFAEKNTWSFDGMVVLAHLQNPYAWHSTADGLKALVDTFESNGVAIRRLSEFFNADLAPKLGIGVSSSP
jgi:peptidoglycan/xylan/chitin deacetylase (PgdA/CDA1 family)